MSEESDPNAITNALETAVDAFNEEGHGIPAYEVAIDTDDDWKAQLTKGCSLLRAVDRIDEDGYYTATIELCFGAIERSMEAYALAEGGDELRDFHDHTHCYDRASELALDDGRTRGAVHREPGGQLLRWETTDESAG